MGNVQTGFETHSVGPKIYGVKGTLPDGITEGPYQGPCTTCPKCNECPDCPIKVEIINGIIQWCQKYGYTRKGNAKYSQKILTKNTANFFALDWRITGNFAGGYSGFVRIR